MIEIPAMTNPLGRYTRQPQKENILLDDTHALMTRKDFEQLMNYSTSYPTGVYPGKMWRRQRGTGWLLCWYGDEVKIQLRDRSFEGINANSGEVTVNFREIIIVE